MSVSISASSVSYPLQKDDWAQAWWKVMHQTAWDYPNNPSRSDKVEAKQMLDLLIKNLPCKTPCRDNAYSYMKENPPKFENKKDYFMWTCNFHNDERKMHGKPEENCELMYNSSSPDQPDQNQNQEECPTCKAPSPQVPDIGADFEKYKEIHTATFEDLCKKDNLKVPKIHFSPCPQFPNTSCVDGSTKEDVYLNPYVGSLKNTLHEYKHYKDILSGTDTTETSANDYAYRMIGDNFPFDNIDGSRASPTMVADSDPDGKNITESKSEPIARYVPDGNPDSAINMVGGAADWQTRFPYYSQLVQQQQMDKIKTEEEKKKEEGFIGYLDRVYEFPAKIAGISSADMNLAQTPLIIESAIMTIIGSNTTPLGAAIISFMTGIGLFAGGVLTKNSLGHRDKVAVQHLASAFLWNTLKFGNPKVSGGIKNALRELYVKVNSGNFSLKDTFIETPGMYKLKQYSKVQRMRPKLYVNPHAAYARARAGAAENLNTIRSMQIDSQARYDSSQVGPNVVAGGGTLLPSEIRASMMPVGGGMNVADVDEETEGYEIASSFEGPQSDVPTYGVPRPDLESIPYYDNTRNTMGTGGNGMDDEMDDMLY